MKSLVLASAFLLVFLCVVILYRNGALSMYFVLTTVISPCFYFGELYVNNYNIIMLRISRFILFKLALNFPKTRKFFIQGVLTTGNLVHTVTSSNLVISVTDAFYTTACDTVAP